MKHIQCKNCSNNQEKENGTRACGANLWDRDMDNFIKDDEKFAEFELIERFCLNSPQGASDG